MDSPSLPLTLSRSMGRSFRNSTPSPTVLFLKSLSAGSSYNASRSISGSHYLPLLRDECSDSSASPNEITHIVDMPRSPEHRTMSAAPHHDNSKGFDASSVVDVDITVSAEQQAVSNTMLTGSYDSSSKWPMKLHQTVDGGTTSHPQLAHASDFTCSVHGCDGKAMSGSNNGKSFPCECKHPICNDCYIDRLRDDGVCPGCGEVYKPIDEEEGHTLSLLAPMEPQMERNLSLKRSMRSQMLMSTKEFDFDYADWLYETKGTYGSGNAMKSQASFFDAEEKSGCICEESVEKIPRPLVRKIKISPAIIGSYRLIVLIRIVALVFFLAWRIRNPNRKAMWLWGMSVICEIWFALSWILEQMPKLKPINRSTDLEALKEKFERPRPGNSGSDLPGIDFFVSMADPDKEPPLITANSILSILAVDYPVEKVACYLSDDSGALYMFEALAEAASYARVWVPFCRKHHIEPRNPESYFSLPGNATKGQIRKDFAKDRRRVKREYDEFKLRINSLPDRIRRRSDARNAYEESKAKQAQIERGTDLLEKLDIPKATWMADGNHWAGTWATPVTEHRLEDHAGIIQVMLKPPKAEPLVGESENDSLLDLTDVDVRLPMLVYVSREKRPGYDHNKKAGAMNALLRVSAIMSNAPFILNLDCDHYIYNSQAVREGMCFMLGVGGENVCFVQFPQRFEGIDPNDRYANHNTVFFYGNMRALDGVQGPMYVGTGCIFRRTALYGFNPPEARGNCGVCSSGYDGQSSGIADEVNSEVADSQTLVPTSFGGSKVLLTSIQVAGLQGQPLAASRVRYGRPPHLLASEPKVLRPTMIAEAISVISCWYEDNTEWGSSIGWIYGSVTEDIVTGYHMHNRGWRSMYCITKQDAFRGTAPINLTDRLHQVLRWATGSIEIFFSHNNSLLAGPRMKLLQRIAYMNVEIAPFTSLFLLVYCFLPALSLFSNQLIVEQINAIFLLYLLVMTCAHCGLAILEVKWAGITMEEWWRSEQFWVIGGTSAQLVAVAQGLLKVVAGIDISFSLTSKASSSEESTDGFEDLFVIKWTALMIPPLTIMLVNLIAIAAAVARSLYSSNPEWKKLLGGIFFSMWVLLHLYPFAKGFMGRRRRAPTIIWLWTGLLATIISLLWVAISSPSFTFSTGFQL